MKNFILAAMGLLLCSGMWAQELSVSTNILDYVNMGTINVGAAYGFARHWSAEAGVKYNPFSFGKGDAEKSLKQRNISAGLRWWPWHIYSGWWAGGRLQYQEYSRAGFRDKSSTEGDRYGGVIAVGYSYMLGPHFNLDFGAGLWGGYDRYVTYECQHCGRRTGEGNKVFLLPNDILLTFSYIF